MAEFAGDALRVTQCRAVNVTEVIWDHKLHDACYAFTPVLVKNLTLFLVPGTRELQLASPIVDCKHVPTAVFKHGTMWTSPKGQVTVHSLPVQFVWQDFQKPVVFKAPALFDDGEHGLANLLLAIHDRHFQAQLLAQRIDRLTNYTSAYAMDPELTRATLLGAGASVVHGVGTWWNMTGHALVSVPSQLVHGLLLGPVQWALNAALITLGLAGALYLIYCIYKWRWWVAATAPFSDLVSPRRLARPEHVSGTNPTSRGGKGDASN